MPIRDFDSLLKILDFLAGLGFQGFETNYRSLESQAGGAADCRRAFESRHVRFVAPHCSADLYKREKSGAEIESLRRIAAYSGEMGAICLILSGGALPHRDGKLEAAAVHTKIEGLNRLGRLCQEEGLKLCYHNEEEEFQDEPSEMSFLLRETDPKLVWLAYDVGNAYGFGPDAGTFSAQNLRRIAIYHLKDVKRDAARNVIPADLGAGLIDLGTVVAPLLESNWEGWLIVERESGSYPEPAEHPEKLLCQSREYLRQLVGI